jgi:abortive infection bacteriophage resistance protein
MNTRFVDSLPDYYNDNFKKNNVPIKKHHQKYENDIYAPAWKTLEFLTFGTVFRIYQELKEENLKIKIANEYGIKKVKVFENFVRTIIFIRNICAHSGVLFDSNTPKEIATTPLIRFNNNNRHSLDSSIKVILYFMGYISENRKIEMKIELENLYQQFEDNSVINKIITEKIGFIK